MRATSFIFTPSTDNVNGLTSSDDGLSEEAEVPTTGTAVSTKGGGESKDGNTVVADAGMKESQSEEDDSSDSESFGKPDSPELPKGAEESLDDREEKEEDHNLKNAPAATNRNSDWDYSRCNICKHPPTTQDKTHSVPTQLRHTRTVPYPGKKLGNFSHGTSQRESGNSISNPRITSSE